MPNYFYIQDQGVFVPTNQLAQSFAALNIVEKNSLGIGTDTLKPISNTDNPNWIVDLQTKDFWGFVGSANSNIYRMTKVGIKTDNPIDDCDIFGTLRATDTVRFTKNDDATNSTDGTLRVTGGVGISKRLFVGSNEDSISTSTGAVQVTGGVGVTKKVFIGDTEDSTSTTSGALRVSGGVGIGKTLNVGGSVTATSFYGDGSNLTGIVTSIVAGNNITVSGSTGKVTINGSLQWVTTNAGIHTLSNVGIGTTNPTSALTVTGNVLITGISTLGITSATNLTSQQLNVSGISTLGITSISNLTSQQLNVSGISTLGITSTTNLTSQQLNVSGISTLGITSATNLTSQQLNVSGISTLGVTSTTNLTSQQLNVSGISTLGITSTSNLTSQQLNVSGISTLGITSATNLTSQQLNVSGISTLGAVKISSGIITASSGIITYFGDGSGLTNIPSGQLTGPLPAIDGSALISVIGSGSGVVIKDSGSPVGTAGTIDFGNNLSVSAISAGIVTVTATDSQWVTTNAGIHTLSNVGIGTTNPTSALTVTGNVLISGIITASSFVGDGSELTGITRLGSSVEQLGFLTHPSAYSSRLHFGIGGVASDYDASTIIVNDVSISDSNRNIYIFDKSASGYDFVGVVTETYNLSHLQGSDSVMSDDGTIFAVSRRESNVAEDNKIIIWQRTGNTFSGIATITQASVGDGTGSEGFGASFDMSSDGTKFVIGSGSNQIVGIGSTDYGTAYVIDRSGSTVTGIATLVGTASTQSSTSAFGVVAMSDDGSTILLGDPVGIHTVNGVDYGGIVYKFTRTGNTVTQVGIITGSRFSTTDRFGGGVEISGDGSRIFVADPNSNVVGAASSSGIVYVYDSNLNEIQQISPHPNTTTGGSNTDGLGFLFRTSSLNYAYGKLLQSSYDGEVLVIGDSGISNFYIYIYDTNLNRYILNEEVDFPGGSGTSGFNIAVSGDGTRSFIPNPNYQTNKGALYYYQNSFSNILQSIGSNIGIGTANPTSKLHVVGDARVGINTSQGVILTSEDGTSYRLILSNAGVLSTVLVT